MYPPSTGPKTGADMVVIDQIVSAVARRCGGKTEISSAWLPGISGPETAPCKTRKATSTGRFHAIPHRKEATVNARSAAVNTRTMPKRIINHPVRGTSTALVAAKAVMTQVPLSLLTPRSPHIVGSDTLAMVESSTCMNVPSAKAKAVMASFAPVSRGVVDVKVYFG